jgi:Leucine Rich repeats (2 copies)
LLVAIDFHNEAWIMAGGDIKQVEPLIKELSPRAEVKKAFYQTLFGSLMGQTLFFMGLLAIYFAVVAVLYSFAKAPLQAFWDDLGALWFWSALAVPLACILLFQMLPTALRALREKRLRAIAIGGVPKPGYFRLQPYGASDHHVFKRLDGAGREVLNWLKSAKSPLLYLSGASGVGKSSLLSAGVLPQLRDAGWTVVETRIFGDPVERLRNAVFEDERIFKRKPTNANKLSLRELLKIAAEVTARTHAAPLLLVIDQFEEFLILHDETARAALVLLLSDLSERPIDGLKLLLVFRSDYQPLVFKLDLPPLVSGESWHQLAPYDRSKATSMLQGGGRELSPSALDALFRELDRIEDAPGLYRPITLNMIGLVLETMGGTLHGDASKLIPSYLTDSLTASASRDFVKPVLAEMITEAGTKEPLTEAELVDKAHLELWQVRATLADLARRGLVRRLEGAEAIWEIAHDFLARTIGQLLARLNPTFVERARPLVAPVVLIGWVIVFAMALPFWRDLQQQAAKRTLGEEFDARIYAAQPRGTSVALRNVDELRLARATRFLNRLDELALNLSNTRITSLEPLRGLTSLSSLDLTSTGITDLQPLTGLTSLSSLSLGHSGITSLEPLRGLTSLSSLNLTSTGIIDLEPLRGLTSLSWLDLSSTGITDLEPLRGLTRMSWLDLSSTGITELEPLKGLTSLSSLDLSGATGITSLEPLEGLSNLKELHLSDATGITSLEPLKGMKINVRDASDELLATMR